jgi:serine/threonine-protein kinase
MILAPGTRLGAFEIVGLLGAGGMGEVYRARDPRLGREVAIKILPEALREDPERLARFEREARAASRMSDPHVVSVFDVGREGTTAFLVTELIDGTDLRAELAGGPLPLARAVEWAAQIAEGLAAAHECGVEHRDLKPENVLVTRAGTVKIADFGLARMPEVASPGGADAPTMSSYSVPGVVIGTPGYMSPEQVRGEATDARSDIFSFGTLVYEMLSGRPPFGGGASADVIAAILKEDPPDLRRSRPPVPAALERIVTHCLEKRPERRFQSARDLAFALRDLSLSPEAAPHSVPVVSGPTRSALPLPPGTRLAGQAAPVLAISRDGTKLAYVAEAGEGPPHLFVSHLDRGETREVPRSAHAVGPFFSPDGLWLAFAADLPAASSGSGELRKFSFSSGLTQTVCPLPDYQGGCWGEDGSIYFVGDVLEGLRGIPQGGGPERAILPRFRLGGESVRRCIGYPRLYDGVRWAVVLDWDASALGDTSVLELSTGSLQSVAASGSTGVVTKTGHLLHVETDGTLFAAALQPSGPGRTGSRVAALRDVALDHAGGVFAVSDTGTLAYARGQIRGSIYESRRLVRIDSPGGGEPMAFPPDALTSFRVSPDGRSFVVNSRLTGLWVCDLRRGTRTRLPAGSMRLARYPMWSPDGEWVVFRGAAIGEMGYKLFRQRADGSEPPEIFYGFDAVERRPRAFAADGETLLCEISGGEEQRGIWGVSWRNPQTTARLVAGPREEARLSPDGRFVVYQSGEFGPVEIFVQRLAERAPGVQVSVGGGRLPRWSRDGSRIVFASGDRFLAASFDGSGERADCGPPRELFVRSGVEEFEPAPDGEGFLTIERLPDSGVVSQIELITGWFGELEQLVPSSGQGA